jgi:hypothetical protein
MHYIGTVAIAEIAVDLSKIANISAGPRAIVRAACLFQTASTTFGLLVPGFFETTVGVCSWPVSMALNDTLTKSRNRNKSLALRCYGMLPASTGRPNDNQASNH